MLCLHSSMVKHKKQEIKIMDKQSLIDKNSAKKENISTSPKPSPCVSQLKETKQIKNIRKFTKLIFG